MSCAQGTRFTIAGKTFFPVGTNWYAAAATPNAHSQHTIPSRINYCSPDMQSGHTLLELQQIQQTGRLTALT